MAVPVLRKPGQNEKNNRPAALLTALRAALLPSTRIDALGGDPNFMTSLARGLSVIQCFSHATSFLTVSQISQATGFSRASVRRCLYTLSKLGLANSEDGTHFTLLPGILTLGHSYIFSMPLAKVVQPVLDRLSQVLRESCSIAMLDGHDVIHVAHSNVSRVLAVDLSMGSRLPAIYTSMGRVLL
ncbi:MAG: helix-turn-helix domain-containing protein, partial [Candidatus Acidiferrales bacterium]